MIRWLRIALTASAIGALAACGSSSDPQPNLVETAQADDRLGTLSGAVQASGLSGTMTERTYTLFAPTNAAFDALLDELGITQDELVADQALLETVLNYHLVQGRVTEADVRPGAAIETEQGGIFKIESRNGQLVVVDGRGRTANIVETNIDARNGVVHVIDRVLLPPENDIVQLAIADPRFATLVEAVIAADLVETLSGPGPFTVFAPTNEAFETLLADLGVSREQAFADPQLLRAILGYHVLPARVLEAEVPPGVPVTTTMGQSLAAGPALDGRLVVEDQQGRIANIVETDILATNGVIHVIDTVLLPQQ
jgi:uncharacterized surface protein with fasciclin (FAS1) repeats